MIQGSESFFVDRKYEFYPTKIAPSVVAALPSTLVDGELVLDEVPGGGKRTTFLIFDAICVKGSFVGDLSLSDRLRVVRGEVMPPFGTSGIVDQGGDYEFTVGIKHMYRKQDVKLVLEQVLPSLPHENDGLIFTREDEPYKIGTCEFILKWKPLHLNSVDFLLEVVYLKNASGKMEGRYCTLKCGSSGQLMHFGYIHIEAAKQEDLLKTHGRAPFIAECVFDMEWSSPGPPANGGNGSMWSDWTNRPGGGWKYLRHRPDKKLPNNINTVENVFKSIRANIVADDLVGYSRNDYFMYFYI